MIWLTISLGVACAVLLIAAFVLYTDGEGYRQDWINATKSNDVLFDLLGTSDAEYFAVCDQLEAVEFQLEMALEREQDLLAVVVPERDADTGLPAGADVDDIPSALRPHDVDYLGGDFHSPSLNDLRVRRYHEDDGMWSPWPGVRWKS